MEIYTSLFILCVSIACSAFLGHAAGYRRGIVRGRVEGRIQARRRDRVSELRKAIREHNDEIGL